MSIRLRLLLLVVAVTIPLIASTLFVTYQLSRTQTGIQRDAMLGTTRILAALSDDEIETYLGIGFTLAASTSLKNDDIRAFYEEAVAALQRWPDIWLILVAKDGTQVFHTLRPFGDVLPKISDVQTFDRAITERRWQISEVRTGLVSKEHVLNLFVPVIAGDEIRYSLLIALRPAIFERLLNKQKLSRGWLSGIIDQSGNFIARNLSNDELVGKPASAGWRRYAKTADEGLFENASLEGVRVYSAFVNSKLTGWSISVAATESTLIGALRTSLILVVLSGLVALIISSAFALWQSRKITAPLTNLKEASAAIARQESVPMRITGMPEVDEAMRAFTSASDAILKRDQQQESSLHRLRLMTNELNHRVKNTLAVILSMSTITARNAKNVDEFSKTFDARVRSLSRTHDVLTQSSWEEANLRDIVESETRSFQNTENTRIVLTGANVKLSPKTAVDLGMVIHELTTNAAKYGSLSVPNGAVHASWYVEKNQIVFEWLEKGGPPVVPPNRKGFGSRLVDQLVKGSGTYVPNYDIEGFSCAIILPLTRGEGYQLGLQS